MDSRPVQCPVLIKRRLRNNPIEHAMILMISQTYLMMAVGLLFQLLSRVWIMSPLSQKWDIIGSRRFQAIAHCVWDKGRETTEHKGRSPTKRRCQDCFLLDQGGHGQHIFCFFTTMGIFIWPLSRLNQSEFLNERVFSLWILSLLTKEGFFCSFSFNEKTQITADLMRLLWIGICSSPKTS